MPLTAGELLAIYAVVVIHGPKHLADRISAVLAAMPDPEPEKP